MNRKEIERIYHLPKINRIRAARKSLQSIQWILFSGDVPNQWKIEFLKTVYHTFFKVD